MFDVDELDRLHLMDMEFEETVKLTFGPDVHHVSNFDLGERERVEEIIKYLDGFFIERAFVCNGTPTKSLIGLYTTDFDSIPVFWRKLKEVNDV